MDEPISCRIISLNFNAKDLLERFLPSLVRSAKASRFPCKVTVLDNCSTDDSVSYVKTYFPDVEVVIAPENKVLCSYNDVVRDMDEDIVILINNDMETEKDFVDPLVEVFLEKPDAFFVATHGDCSIARSHWGVVTADITYPGVGAYIENPGYAFSAGVCAFDRKKFVQLNGYDEIYLPALYEDVDLCYRGWKMGWKGYYQPASKKYHIGSASMSRRYTSNELQMIAFRNGILFMFKNISDPIIMINFIFFLILRLVSAILLNKWFLIRGFIESVQRFPKALESRRRNLKKVSYSDRELLHFINDGRAQKTHIRILKRWVNYLGSTPILRKPAFIISFFTLRFVFPLEFFLLRELIDCKSVLDLGCGGLSPDS